jgi:dTDP-glucose 4,6-dehydratase
MTRVLLTGAGGFFSHHCLEHLLVNTDWEIAATDSFRHKGATDRISQVLAGFPGYAHDRVSVITHDLTAPFSPRQAHRIAGTGLDYIIAAASESHVDRSIADPVPFTRNNIDVMLSTLELARQLKPRAVVVLSTDEVYGPEVNGIPHPEWDAILPSNPYSGSKAAQETLAIAWWRTYGVPVILVNCMNLAGERQDPEKFIPMTIRAVLHGDEVTVHGTPGDIGTRHWLHCRNLADGILHVLNGPPPAAYSAHAAPGALAADRPDRWNIASPDRISNLEIAQMVAAAAGKPLRYRLEDAHSYRPGHDLHYGLDGTKIAATGWKPPVPFAESLEKTVTWSIANPEWLLPG